MTQVQNTKSKLAKLLAIENITVQHRAGAKTAHFELKNRILVLPIWKVMSDELYDMLVIHEVGHALNTPVDGWINAMDEIAARVLPKNPDKVKYAIKDFLNVVEDIRNDKLQMRRYPGSKRDYVIGYQELIEGDFFGEDIANRVNKLPFIDRLNIRFKGGVMLGIRFLPEEKVFVSRAEKLETWDEVIQLTEDIFEYSRAKGPHYWEKTNNPDQDRFFEKMITDTDQIINKEEFEEDQKKELEEMQEEIPDVELDQVDIPDEEVDSIEDDELEDTDTNDEPNLLDPPDFSDPSQGEEEEEEDEDWVPESETEKAWSKSREGLVDGSGPSEVHYLSIPTLTNPNLVIDDYKVVLKQQSDEVELKSRNPYAGGFANPEWRQVADSRLRAFKDSESNSISFMVKEFEMKKRADEYRRTATSKTGVIDVNKLHTYKFSEDIFRGIENVSEGKNHGFVIFLDWSSSMNRHIRKTVMQLFQIAWFCKRVQIPFEVYIFRSMCPGESFSEVWSKNPLELNTVNYKMRNLLSSRMNNNEFNQACNYLWYTALGQEFKCDPRMSTPLNESIITAVPVVRQFQSRTKVQVTNVVFLTDGDATSGTYAHSLSCKGQSGFVLQDQETKKSYNLKAEAFWFRPNSREITDTLLQLLKDKTGCNLFGFFIMSSGAGEFSNAFNKSKTVKDASNIEAARSQFKKNGFCQVLTEKGYDEYYLINTAVFSIDDKELNFTEGDSSNKIAREMQRFMSSKTSNRLLLRNFINRIVA